MKHALAPVMKQSLADKLAQQIWQLIQTSGYKAGDRLPTIMDMAQRFRVGHPTVREALRKLETMGTVEIRHGSGVYVTRSDDVLVVASPGYAGEVTKKLLVDLIQARIPIEMQSARLAARNAGPEHLDEMRALLASAGRSLDDDAELNRINMAYHKQIALASGNTVLAQLLDVLRDLFAEEQRMILDIFGSRTRDHTEHLEILAALEARDEPLAVDRMRKHLEGVQKVLQRWDPEKHPVK
jgi:GntR family transcriptional regulator, transcriptional repressor for pyruvate dehydrogenase complex